MKPNETKTVSQWDNENIKLSFEACDNGDGDGPHYYGIKLKLNGNCSFWGNLHIDIPNRASLQALSDAVNQALYYEQQFIPTMP